jgi:rhodanese-related sulfurtransferase/DNA-binding transcriptional ArsR family regulator
MGDRRNKDSLYEQLARVGKAVGASRRLELLDLLVQAPRTVEDLSVQAEMSIANTSQHLHVLRDAGLVVSSKDGLYVTYRLASLEVAELCSTLRRLAEARLVEMQRIREVLFATSNDLAPVTGKELLSRMQSGEVVLIDVRPAVEYEAGHIRGALSIPHDELRHRIRELPKGKSIVAYCRGPYCVFAATAVKLLRRRGFAATRIEDGVAEWRARGLRVVTPHEASAR